MTRTHVCERPLGERHPHYALCLTALASLHRSQGRTDKAVESAALALKAVESHLDDSFDHLRERQRGLAVRRALPNLGLLLTLHEQAISPAAVRYAPVLAWKGRVASRGELERAASDGASGKAAGERREARPAGPPAAPACIVDPKNWTTSVRRAASGILPSPRITGERGDLLTPLA